MPVRQRAQGQALLRGASWAVGGGPGGRVSGREARAAAPALAGLGEQELTKLWERLFDLPSHHLSLLVVFPELLTSDPDRLRRAVADDDPKEAETALPPVLAHYDTPPARARIARAVIAIRESGDIDGELAAVSLVDLTAPSGALIHGSLPHSVAVATGSERTPAGLVLAGY